MMKKLVLILGIAIFGFSEGHAESCTAVLRNLDGGEIESFQENGVSSSEACLEAKRECEREFKRRDFSDIIPNAFCDVAELGSEKDRDDRNHRGNRGNRGNWGDWNRRHSGNNNYGRVVCEFNLVSRLGGFVLNTYRSSASGRNALARACYQADAECSRHSGGPILTCVRGYSYN